MSEPPISEALAITINGQTASVPAGETVRSLLASRGLSPDNVAIELNRRLLKSDRYDDALRANDVIEIVTFVGGG